MGAKKEATCSKKKYNPWVQSMSDRTVTSCTDKGKEYNNSQSHSFLENDDWVSAKLVIYR